MVTTFECKICNSTTSLAFNNNNKSEDLKNLKKIKNLVFVSFKNYIIVIVLKSSIKMNFFKTKKLR